MSYNLLISQWTRGQMDIVGHMSNTANQIVIFAYCSCPVYKSVPCVMTSSYHLVNMAGNMARCDEGVWGEWTQWTLAKVLRRSGLVYVT